MIHKGIIELTLPSFIHFRPIGTPANPFFIQIRFENYFS